MRLKTTQTADDETVNGNVLFRGSLCRNGARVTTALEALLRHGRTRRSGADTDRASRARSAVELAAQHGRCAGGGELLLRRAAFSLYSASCARSHASQSVVHRACGRLQLVGRERERRAGGAVERGALGRKELRARSSRSGCQASSARGSLCASRSAGANSSSERQRPRARERSSRAARSSATIWLRRPARARPRRSTAPGEAALSTAGRRAPAMPRQLAAAVQRDELDQERQRVHFAAEPLDQIGGRARRAAGGEQVVDDQHPLPLLHRVVVDLERVGAVLEVVGRADAGRRQLARLAHRREAGADPVGDGGAEDEAAALDADDEVDALILERQRRGCRSPRESPPRPAAAW